jgi:hypothetical protein
MAPPFDDDVVSPELALVDRDLAARARVALPELALRRLSAAAAAPDVIPASSMPARWRHRVPGTPVLTLLATAVASLVVISFTGPGPERASGEAPTASEMVFESGPLRTAGTRSAEASPGEPVPASAAAQSSPSLEVEAVGRRRVAARNASVASRATAAEPGSRYSSPALRAAATTLVWPRSTQASAYDLELVRDGTIIFAKRSSSPQALVPRSWSYDGVSYAIQPEDQAYVWPVIDGHRSKEPVVDRALAFDLTPVERFVELSRS